jgi:hypothetical protein
MKSFAEIWESHNFWTNARRGENQRCNRPATATSHTAAGNAAAGTSDGPQSLPLTRVLRGERNRYQPWFLSLFTSCCAAKFALTRFKPIPHHRGVGGLVIRQSLREPTRLSRCSRCSYRLHPCGRGRRRESPCCTKRCPDSSKSPVLMWYRVA